MSTGAAESAIASPVAPVVVGSGATDGAAAAVVSTAAARLAASNIVLVKDETLFKSEPHPAMFGNDDNPDPDDLEEAGWNNANWLKSRFHFSFAEYRGGRSNFGPLRVANDDLVQPQRGFGTHPHSNMEIVTYIVNGNLTHKVCWTRRSLGEAC
jgi:hypothetical protein